MLSINCSLLQSSRHFISVSRKLKPTVAQIDLNVLQNEKRRHVAPLTFRFSFRLFAFCFSALDRLCRRFKLWSMKSHEFHFVSDCTARVKNKCWALWLGSRIICSLNQLGKDIFEMVFAAESQRCVCYLCYVHAYICWSIIWVHVCKVRLHILLARLCSQMYRFACFFLFGYCVFLHFNFKCTKWTKTKQKERKKKSA